MLGGTTSDGMVLGLRNGDFARSCGLPGAGVVNPGVPSLELLFWNRKSASFARSGAYGKQETLQKMQKTVWQRRCHHVLISVLDIISE